MVAHVTAADIASDREHDRARFGLGLLLFSHAMFFTALVGAYIVLYKTHRDEWPPPGVPELGLGLSSIGTLLLAASVLPALFATRAVRRDDPRGTRYGLGLAAMAGTLFLGLQAVEWLTLSRAGLQLGLTYGSCYYVLTAFHGSYVLAGLAVLAFVLARAVNGRYSARRHIGVDLAGILWCFVSAVWLLLFGALYLLPRFA